MSTGQAPSVGPAINGESSLALLDKYRQSTNAAPVVAVAAGAAQAIFTPISVRTRVANEEVRVICTVSRDNADPAGTGTYQMTLDGVAAGPTRTTFGNNAEGLAVLDTIRSIPAAGVHTIGVQVTAAGGDETVAAGATMLVQANEFA